VTQEPDYEFKFSSGQMVMIICGLLGVMLLCFMGGLVLGKKESAVDSGRPALASKAPAEQSKPAKPASTKAPQPAPTSQRKPATQRVSSKPPAPKPATATPKATAQAKDAEAKAPPKVEAGKTEKPAAPTETEAKPAEDKPPATEPAPTAEKPVAAEPAPEEPAAQEPAPSKPSEGRFTIQVASSRDKSKGEQFVENLIKAGYEARLEEARIGDVVWFRVRVGSYATRDQAKASLGKLKAVRQFADSYVVEK
jgi:cell division protein FtsN